ncbi:TPA: hypothetical protein I8370_001677 [Klebsiella oxytoca]|nr:hypothetical protein [Klebsiella oxytoca]
MDISSFNGRTAEIVIFSTDTYLKEGLARMIAETMEVTGQEVIHRGHDLYRISLAGRSLFSPGRGDILLMDERIFTDPSLRQAALSDRMAKACHRAVMLSAGSQNFCGEHHLNISLSMDALGHYLSWLFSAEAPHQLCLHEILRPLSAKQKFLLGLLSEGRTLREAALRMHCSIKSLYQLRRQSCQRLGINTLSEMRCFMGFYRFMVYHEGHYVGGRN